MPRIRTIKPDFWEDELIGQLSRDARLLFIGTWNYADDEGRIRWAPAYIKSKIFLYDDDLDVDAVAALMAELEKFQRVRTYMVEGATTQRFAVIVNFPKHQVINRASDSSLPPPPPDPSDPSGSTHGDLSEEAVNDQGALMERSSLEGKGREGKGRERKGSPRAALAGVDLARFEEFYKAFPKHKDRRDAEGAWVKAVERGVDPGRITAAARDYAVRTAGSRYVKYPATWLNKGCYDDEPDRPVMAEKDRMVNSWKQYLTDTGTEGPGLRALPGGNR